MLNVSYTYANSLSINDIAKNSQWLKLLHYKNNDEKQGSYVISDSFFLSPLGKTNALEELQATIKAFYLPEKVIGAANQHAQCLFPARLKFIQQQLNFSQLAKFPKVKCPTYKKWRESANINSISVIFASGYLSNPASMYGHLLLKLNNNKNNNLLNVSLNYGAIVPDKENPIVYVIKGIFGGYNAGYSDQQFYRHQQNYSDIELRDMWEYKLSLSKADIDMLASHIWELFGKKFDYYFVDENCAFHIAKLLEVILDNRIISDDSLWVLPSTVAQGISKIKYQNKPLLEKTKYIPSKETVLHYYFNKLTKEQKQVAFSLLNNQFDFKNIHYKKLTDDNKNLVIESLWQYLDVLKQSTSELDRKSFKAQKHQLVLERLKLPVGKVVKNYIPTKKHLPHTGMPASKFSVGAVTIENLGNYSTAGFRMTYFDDLSSNIARDKFTNLEMLDIELFSNQNSIKIAKFDVIDIKSLYKPEMPWQQKNNMAWTIKAGFEQINNNCLNCGIYFTQGEWGKSFLYNNTWLGYGLLGGKLFAGYDNDLNISVKVGTIIALNSKINAKLEFKQYTNIAFTNKYTHQYLAEINYNFAKNWELRLLAEKQKTALFEVKINYFWGF